MAISDKAKKIVKRIFRIAITIVLVILGIILLVLVLIQTGPVQNYGRGKIEALLENKLHTKVRIGNLYIGFPSRIILKNIYLEDRRKDTLISGGRIEVGISMLKLFSKELQINNIELDDITCKVRRQLPDSVFNFQFIADAFSSGTAPKKADTSAGFHFIVGTVHLHHVHAVYFDDASGNDVNVYLGDFKTKLKTFDPSHQSYAIPDIALADISGNIRQYKPILLLQHVADTISAHNRNSDPIKLDLDNIDFTRINLGYRNEAQNMNAAIKLGSFHTKADSIDLATFHIKLHQIALNNTVAMVRFGKLSTAKTKQPPAKKDTAVHAGSWNIQVAAFTIDNTQLQYDDDNKVALRKGIDYNHLQVNHLNVYTSDLQAGPDRYQGNITKISFDEKSGLVLRRLSTRVLYNSAGASLKDLVIQTNNSEIKNQTSLRYKSLDDLKSHPGDIVTNLEFNRSRFAVKDILIFVPSLEEKLKENRNAVLLLNGKLTGLLKDFRIPYLEITGVGNTSLGCFRIRSKVT